MIRLTQAISAVMASTVASGVAGGVVGAAVGRFAPSFVSWIYAPGHNQTPPGFDPTEFGFGLGIVSGLVMGSAASVFLVVVLAVRDAWLARAGLLTAKPAKEALFD